MQRWILTIVFGLIFAAPALAAHRPEVTLDDLTLLAESDISDETTLVFLASREVGFELDAEAIVLLREQGISEEIIQHLLGKASADVDRDDRERDRVVAVSSYPSNYYVVYYGYGYHAYPHTILGHWTHGYYYSYYSAGHYAHAGNHRGISFGHRTAHDGRHLVGGHTARNHSGNGHRMTGRSGSHGGNHGGSSHTGRHASGGHSRGGHGGGRH